MYYFYPKKGVSFWTTPFPGGSHEFLDQGARMSMRCSYILPPFLCNGYYSCDDKGKMVGKGSQYAVAYVDSKGHPFNGSNTYKVHLPANVPAKDFWSFTLYDNQTRSMLQTDQRFPGLDSNKKGLLKKTKMDRLIFILDRKLLRAMKITGSKLFLAKDGICYFLSLWSAKTIL